MNPIGTPPADFMNSTVPGERETYMRAMYKWNLANGFIRKTDGTKDTTFQLKMGKMLYGPQDANGVPIDTPIQAPTKEEAKKQQDNLLAMDRKGITDPTNLSDGPYSFKHADLTKPQETVTIRPDSKPYEPESTGYTEIYSLIGNTTVSRQYGDPQTVTDSNPLTNQPIRILPNNGSF